MEHKCAAPGWMDPSKPCAATFHGRSDARYCTPSCRKRAYNARPEVQRRRRIELLEAERTRVRRRVRSAQRRLTEIEQDIEQLVASGPGQLDLMDALFDAATAEAERRHE